jgi:hypothetical protein
MVLAGMAHLAVGAGSAIAIAISVAIVWLGVLAGCVIGWCLPSQAGVWGRYVAGMLVRTPFCLAGAVAVATGHLPGVSRQAVVWIVVFYCWGLAVESWMLVREAADAPDGKQSTDGGSVT